MNTLGEALFLKGVYKELPDWLPVPETVYLSEKHKCYQEVYSRAIEVYRSLEMIERQLCLYQSEMTELYLEESQKWLGAKSKVNVNQEVTLDRYSLLVLQRAEELRKL